MAENDPTLTTLGASSQALPSRAGKYRIVGKVGQGGMGVVYRAIDDDLGRAVALKFIPSEFGGDSDAAQRFLREARAASALDHVNIGTIFGVEETDDGRPFIVMAYYEGQDLSARLRDDSRPIDVSEAVSIAVQVARGLAEAHARGVVHRDIKPSNILITSQGVVKIVDFGLAAMRDSEQLTMAGARMGTPAYMSPEQALGKNVDCRSDIWSLGIVLLEMLTGERVFDGPSAPAVLYKVVHDDIVALERVRQPFRDVVAKALERDPEKRRQSAGEFLTDIESVAPADIAVRPASAWRLTRRRRRFAIAALLLAALAGGYWVATLAPRMPGAPASASVFDQYQQGLQLMKRWDKGDNLDRATTLFTEATKSDPKFALGFARLAETQRLRYLLSRDQTYLEAATRNAAEALRLNRDLAPVQVVLGRLQGLRGENDLAVASIERALQIDPNDADAQLAIARQYERLGRVADAEAAFQKALAFDPDGIAPHDFYANWLLRQGRPADAIREWQTVIRIAPDNAAAWVNLGTALSSTGKTGDAVAAYEQAMKYKPTDMGYNNLGTAYSRTGRYPEAVGAYRKAIEMNGKNYLFHGNLAAAYHEMTGSDVEAKPLFARAIELAEEGRKQNPRDSLVHQHLASYYAKIGNGALAVQRIGTALILAPNSPDVQATAAEVYEVLGQRKKAIAAVRQSMKLGFSRQRLEQYPELVRVLPEIKEIKKIP
jgi:eukaryotic-like serine/threonine-protein kinase